MSRVVYLLGAGASYGIRKVGELKSTESRIEQGIPVVIEIEHEMDFVTDWIKNCNEPKEKVTFNYKGVVCNYDHIKQQLLEDFKWLKDNSSKHATIDTFARKLILRRDDKEYRKLKFLLCVFFLIEQAIHPYDKRYDTFFANILKSDAKIPDDIYIVTWNYDGQLGIAYQDYVIEHSCKVLPKEKVFRINGIADFVGNNSIESCLLPRFNKEMLVLKILNQYVDFVNHNYSDGCIQLHFAWEEYYFKNNSSSLFANISDTKALVVIGYSFPFFNREIDRELFKRMPNLEKIYIQDPRAKEIKEFIVSVLTEKQREEILPKVVTLENTSNFFLPPEL